LSHEQSDFERLAAGTFPMAFASEPLHHVSL